MASDDSQFWRSFHAKMRELQRSHYPPAFLRQACMQRAATLEGDASRRWCMAAETMANPP